MVLPAPGSSASKVAQGLARQHRFVNCGDLMGQWFNIGCVDCHHRIEQVGKVYPVGFDGQLEIIARSIKGPRTTSFGKGKVGLIGAKQHPFQQTDRPVSCNKR